MQRHAVRTAYARMRLYDVGWWRNVEQVFGMGAKRRWKAWVGRLLWGGGWYVRCLFISAPLLPLIFAPLSFGTPRLGLCEIGTRKRCTLYVPSFAPPNPVHCKGGTRTRYALPSLLSLDFTSVR
jgi:hypothetical protein